LKRRGGPVRLAGFTRDGAHLVSVRADGTVEVWDTLTGSVLRSFPGLDRAAGAAGISPDGQRVALAGADGSVKVWDVAAGRAVLTLPADDDIGVVADVAFHPDGNRLATAGRHGRVKVWDIATGKQIALPPLVGEVGGFRCVAFSPDGGCLAAGSVDKTVIVWDIASGRKKFTCRGHSHMVWGLAFSRDGRRLASAILDTTLGVWDMTTGTQLHLLKGHAAFVLQVAFSPDGRRLASAGDDGTVKIWDATTGEAVLSLPHRGGVTGVAFSPDGHRLASADPDGVRIWDARPLTPESAVEREAVGLLACLHGKPLRKEDVREFLDTSPAIDPAVRHLALSLVERYREETDPDRYHQASWAVVRQPFLNSFQYRCALWQAQTAAQQAPDRGEYQTALGAAQYRAGRYHEALATLTRARLLHQAAAADLVAGALPPPHALITVRHAQLLGETVAANLAFLAMTQHRLRQKDEAQSTLERLRRVVGSPGWEPGEDARTCWREAEAVVAGAYDGPR
jgi:WD40 repeat protein